MSVFPWEAGLLSFAFPSLTFHTGSQNKTVVRIFQEYYLATENGFVRGGFILKYQDFVVNGKNLTVVYYHLPLSEGIVNKAYTSTGVFMLRTAIKMQPVLFALGMGGFDKPLPAMLKAMGWSLSAVPFYFKVNRPSRFLRNISPLRTSFARNAISHAAALTGAGWAAIKGIQWMRSRNAVGDIEVEVVNTFGKWADELWQSCSQHYAMIGSRDSGVLNSLYPSGRNFCIIKIVRGLQVIGWAVMLDTQMRTDKYFGDLRVGSLVDCLATPENARAVVQAADDFLKGRGVDLTICNHAHTAWGNAFYSSGFFSAPSNFIFAASKPLVQQLDTLAPGSDQVYLMQRRHGDGPVNL